MTKIVINDKEYSLPSSWDEMTLEQYCLAFYQLDTKDREDETENFKKDKVNEGIILSRLLGESDDFCMNLPLPTYLKLLKSITFMFNIKEMLDHSKAYVKIDGERYMIPSMNEMSLRQYIDADVVLEHESPLQYIELLSILLTKKDEKGKWIPYTGQYESLMDKVRNLSCAEALPLVYHFFKLGHSLERISQASMKMEESQRHQHTANS